jgi:N-acetylneuraminic acid mutarotase
MGVISNKLYFPGGWTTSPALPNNNLWVYDPALNFWTSKASLPTLSAQGACGVISNKLYVTTAANGFSGYYAYLHVYDPAADSWTAKANTPHVHANPAAGVIGNKFYVAGGFDGANTTNILDVYDPAANTWTTKAPMHTSRFNTSGTVLNGKLYVFGGIDSAGNYTNSVEVYDPASDAWTSESSLPTKRGGIAAGTVNGIAYVVSGGNATNANLNVAEALIPTQASINLYAGIWVSGLVGGTYEIDFRSSLATGTWNSVTNLVLSSSPTLFIDTNTPASYQGFYRVLFLH